MKKRISPGKSTRFTAKPLPTAQTVRMQNARKSYRRFSQALLPDPYAAEPAGPCDGIRSDEIAQLCKVDIATARRWKYGQSRVPWTAKVVMTADFASLRGMSAWEGWRVASNELVSPENWRISRNDALSVPLLHGQVKAQAAAIAKLEAEILKLRSQLAQQKANTLEEQPDPREMLPQIITSA